MRKKIRMPRSSPNQPHARRQPTAAVPCAWRDEQPLPADELMLDDTTQLTEAPGAWSKPQSRDRYAEVPPFVTDETSQTWEDEEQGLDHDDLVRQYLSEMGAFSRLTLAEEVALAKKIEEGRHVPPRTNSAATAGIPRHTEEPADQPRLWPHALSADDARTHMIRANLRLVVSIAKQFEGRGLPLLDLIQEGNLGLMKAVDRFDWRRGCRFGTYASWWIKQSIGRAISDQGRMIRLPAHMADAIGRVHRIQQTLMQVHEEEPTAHELAQMARVPEERIEQINQLTAPPVSLDWLLSDGERTVADVVPDYSAASPLDRLTNHERDGALRRSLHLLTTRERRVLSLHYGIGQRRAYTLEEIGRKFGLTRERIRQIELKALKKLRHASPSQRLDEFVETAALEDKPMARGNFD